MKILTQDKKVLTEPGREIWTTLWDGKSRYSVMHIGHTTPLLGVYHSEERAKEVVLEIFNSLNKGKAVYAMPEK